MILVNLIIKGNRDEAFKALSEHGIDARFVREVKGTTVCEVSLDDITPVILWYTEPMGGKIAKPGTLLVYNENQVAA